MSVVCRRARTNDREAVIALWREAFGDPREHIVYFLETFDYINTAFVLCENECVCSMLFLLPTAVQDGERRFNAGYIYAGATRSDARGKGYYRRLLSFAEDAARQEGRTALLLRPATSSLADSYRRMGFTVPLYGNGRPSRGMVSNTPLTATEYGACRRRQLCGQAYVDWDDRTLTYALSWCKASADGVCITLYDEDTVWESLPTVIQKETALLMPLVDDFQTTAPIWFGYGLE